MQSEPEAQDGSPLIPLCASELGGQDHAYVKEALDSGWVSTAGPFVARFERQLAEYLGTGEEISIGDLAQKILGMMGVQAEIQAEAQRVRPELSEVERLCASAERAKQVLGWSPKYDLDKGLEQTIAWIKERGGLYDVKAYAV